jgi:shikimate kinase
MGSGKSTVARLLAWRLKAKAVDLDDEIVRDDGRSPGMIFAEDGELLFREIETRVLRRVLEDTDTRVIALGGGAWASKTNRKLISERNATSIWLDAPFELCWQRVLASPEVRPLARNKQEARELYARRRASYQCADVCVEAGRFKSADEIALEIIQIIPLCASGEG